MKGSKNARNVTLYSCNLRNAVLPIEVTCQKCLCCSLVSHAADESPHFACVSPLVNAFLHFFGCSQYTVSSTYPCELSFVPRKTLNIHFDLRDARFPQNISYLLWNLIHLRIYLGQRCIHTPYKHGSRIGRRNT